MKKILSIISLVSLCAGCTMGMRQKPGHSIIHAADTVAEAVQPQDPKEPMTQSVNTSVAEEKIIPQNSVVETGIGTNAQKITLSAPMPVKTVSTKVIETKVGGSQKNTAQDIIAKLASMRWIQILGVLIALFGVASIAYPPLRLIINSATTSAWLIGAGAALIFLPIVIVGHEILILCFAVGGAGLWFLAHRHGGLSGELNVLRGIVAGTPKAAPSIPSPPAAQATVPVTPFKAP
jgi:hypothetical protein